MASPNTTMSAGIIQGKGGNYWNLNTGELSLDFVPSSVQSQLNRLESDVEDAQWDATMARNITNRITFTSSGMQIEGTNGQTQQVATYNQSGFEVQADTATIMSGSGTLAIRDWGVSFHGGGCHWWVTDGTGDQSAGGAVFQYPDGQVVFDANGIMFNGKRVAFETAAS